MKELISQEFNQIEGEDNDFDNESKLPKALNRHLYHI